MASSINASNAGAGGLISTADASGVLQLQSAGTTAVTIDTSQNVGIGTTSPTNFLDISKTQNAETNIGLSNTSTGADAQVRTKYTTNSGLFTVGTTGTAHPYGGDAYIYQVANKGIRFATNDTERMRIDSSGYVGIGTSNPGTTLQVTSATGSNFVFIINNTNASTPFGQDIFYTSAAPNGTGSAFFNCRDNAGGSTTRATIRSNGGLANYSANNVNLSDAREKTNIELAGSYLDKICAIPVKTFLYNDQTDTDLNLGVIAQDVQAVAPELVSESNWGTEEEPKERLSIYQTDLQYALMKCIQEQQTIINDLKARVTALEAK